MQWHKRKGGGGRGGEDNEERCEGEMRWRGEGKENEKEEFEGRRSGYGGEEKM